MDKIDWQLINALYEHGSMAKAGAALFISQPAVSYRMSRMEEEFSQTLFYRTNHGIRLTSAGMRLQSYAHLMLQYDNYIYDVVSQGDDELSGVISLGVTSNILAAYLAGQLRLFSQLHPRVEFHLHVSTSFDLLQRIKTHELMMALIRGENNWTGPTIKVYEEPLLIISSEPITDEMLYNRPVIMNYSHIALTYPVNEWIGEFFNEKPPLISPIQLNSDSASLKALVRQGFGWAVISKTRLYPDTDLYHKPIYHRDGTPFRFRTYLVYSEECDGFDNYRAYILHLTEYFARLTDEENAGRKADALPEPS